MWSPGFTTHPNLLGAQNPVRAIGDNLVVVRKAVGPVKKGRRGGTTMPSPAVLSRAAPSPSYTRSHTAPRPPRHSPSPPESGRSSWRRNEKGEPFLRYLDAGRPDSSGHVNLAHVGPAIVSVRRSPATAGQEEVPDELAAGSWVLAGDGVPQAPGEAGGDGVGDGRGQRLEHRLHHLFKHSGWCSCTRGPAGWR